MSLLQLKNNESARRVIQPLVNIGETEKEVILEAEMVGLAKEDINLELKNDELIVSGKSRECEAPRGYTIVHSERCPFEYSRSFSLGDMIDRDKIDAQYENGILKVTLRKIEAAHPRKIEIKG